MESCVEYIQKQQVFNYIMSHRVVSVEMLKNGVILGLAQKALYHVSKGIDLAALLMDLWK